VVCRPDFFYAVALEKNGNAIAVTPIIISNEILGLNSKSSCFAQLLDNPEHCRMLRDTEMDDFSTLMAYYNEDVDEPERKHWNNEEVSSPSRVHMILDKCLVCKDAFVSLVVLGKYFLIAFGDGGLNPSSAS
jgi:hypothetical protein